jgi:putative tryptophan/tyrosine transport system substrate-binding protein
MKRITLLILILVVAAFFPLNSASAENPKALFLYWRGETECEQGLKTGMEKLGLNVDITEFNADQDKNKLKDYLSSVDEKHYDFIYAFGTTLSLTAAGMFKQTPILFGIVSAPVESGLIQSWDAPGGNVTGVSHAVPNKDEVQLITGMGEFKKIGVIYNRLEENSRIVVVELGALLKEKGIDLITYAVDSPEAIAKQVTKIKNEKPDLVYLPSDSLILSNAEPIIKVLNEAGIPTYGAVETHIRAGAMIGIVSSYFSVGQELAGMAEEILQGKKPSEIPSKRMSYEQQTILVNGKTVEAIGYEIPFVILQQAKILE